MELATIFSNTARFTHDESDLIDRAYCFAETAHMGQTRKSGEPYMVHCIAVAQILADLKMDASTIAAALLHDVIEDVKTVKLQDLETGFGLEVARLVDGVTKMEHLPTTVRDHKDEKDGKRAAIREAEYLRKTFLAMGHDIRVILIKLADRLHNMRTLGYLSPERQERMARETLEIFAPLANRLGIWQMKWELEDLCFRYLNPEKYREIATKIAERQADRAAYMKSTTDKLRAELVRAGIHDAQISGRPKHIYSIYRKMERKHVPFEQVYDVRAVRVIVPDKPTCYHVLGVVHSIWHPIHGEFDDYIAAPKDNFYQSLHTAVLDDEAKTLEVQIRTPDMHEHAEYGIAAHWRYKEGTLRDEQFERRIVHLRRLMEFAEDNEVSSDAEDYVAAMKSDVLQEERIYVFTPKGDIIDLPAYSTPIDFAYHIHTQIGDRCRGARVNGALVNLDYKLQSGDRTEIITAKRGGPSLDWLNEDLGYTATSRARAKIRGWFRKQSREQNVLQGRDVVDRELKRLGLDTVPREMIANLFNVQTDDFLSLVGFGEITGAQISTKVLEEERRKQRERESMANTAPPIGTPQPAAVDVSDGIDIMGDSGMLIKLARCCNPTQGDGIVGYITRGMGVTVHRADCPNVINASEPERFINVNWGRLTERTYPVQVMVVAFDREGLMRDIGGVAADARISLSNVNINTKNNVATFLVTMEVENTTQLAHVLTKIEKLPNVIEARRRTAG